MISDRDVQQYRDTGYLVVPDVLDAELLARVSKALDDSGGQCGGGVPAYRCL